VQAAAFAIGVALYTIDWGAVRKKLSGGRAPVPATP